MKITYKNWMFDSSRIEKAAPTQEQSLSCESISADTLTVVVRCDDPSIMAFQKNDAIRFWENDSDASMQTYYLRSIERTGATAYKIVAWSAVGLLATIPHKGGIYTGQTVSEVISDICGAVPVVVKSVFANVKLYGWLPYCQPKTNGQGKSARDNLAQALFAIGAYLTTDLNGVLHIDSLWDGTASVIQGNRMYLSGGKVGYSDPISAVTVTEHQYVAGTEVKELFSGTAQNGDIITFSEPMHSLSATGFTILESGANYAKISAGTGALTGKAYIHNTRLITQPVTAGAVENIKSVTDATLVSLVNSYAVAKRLADYYRCRETITNDIVSGHEKPGHVVSVYHPYDKKMVSACIQSLDTTMSATLKSSMEALVGFTPAQPDTSQYYNVRQEILEDTEIVIPEGTTSIHAVLGSAGDDGQAGANGTAGTDGGYARINSSETGTSVGTQGKGGAGGKGGLGGSGGKVLSADLEVSPGDVLHIHIGLNAGQKETTITLNGKLVSSAQGAVMAAGYTDPTTGDVYSVPGVSGIDGAAGGNAQTTTADASSGGNVGEFTGAHGTSARLEDYTNTDKVADGYTQSTNSSTGQYGTFTGREDISTDKDGYVTFLGREKTIGGTASSFADGTAYRLVSSDSNYTQYRKGVASKPNVTVTTVTNTHKYKTVRARTTYGNLGSGGGGAAQGANASDAAGANAAAPDAPTKRGSGGNGGNGGGGGGGGGGGYVAITGDAAASAGGRMYGLSGGTPGQGSKGSHGSDGYAILYYGLISKSHTGPLATSDGKWLLDALDRRMIV